MIRFLTLIAVFSLPFTSGMTLPLRFPLKIYEVALGLAACVTLCRGRLRVPSGLRREWRVLAAFCAVVAALFLWRQLFPAPVDYHGAFESRFGPMGDGLTKIAYLVLAAFGFVCVALQAFSDSRAVVRAWLAGAAVGAGYLWYTFFCGVFGVDPLMLPGMRGIQSDHHSGLTFYRSGTFLEGNYAGLYFLLSGAVALHAGRRRFAAFMVLSLIPTLSTINWLALGAVSSVLAMRWTWMELLRRKYVVAGVLLLGSILAVWGLHRSGYLLHVMTRKFGTDRLHRRDSSFGDRLNLSITGLRMFEGHPVAGVGVSQFGYQYRQYQSTHLFDWMHLGKMIPNNVYVELLSELGLAGFSLFAAFLWCVWGRSGRAALSSLRYGLAATLIVFLAFSSYSLFYLWAYWGLLSGVSCRLRHEDGTH